MEMVSKRRDGSIRWYLLGILVAVELLMSFSFLGYFHVEPISITIAYIPVLAAGALIGPADSMILGAVFGLASMWKATASDVMPLDQLFSPVMSGRPVESVLLSVGSRTLFGLLVGLLYLAARRSVHEGIWVGVISYFGQFLHAVLVYGVLWALFPEEGYGPADAVIDLVSARDVLANLVTAGGVLLFWRIQRSSVWRQFQTRVEMARSLQLDGTYHRLSLAVMILLTVCSSVAVTFYFVHRIDYVLEEKGIVLDGVDYSNLLHLQIQFLIGILSMMALVTIFLIFNRRYATYMNYEAKMDALTGAMTRKSFFQACGRALENMSVQQSYGGYFIMADLDWLKDINDCYGHPEGDRVLKEVSRNLKEIFREDSLVGRVGGDEFAVMRYAPMTQKELEVLLSHFQERVRRITWGERRASCSIGVVPVLGPGTAEELYRDADRLL